MNVPAMQDLIQEHEGHNKIPEIRVWCCPGKINKSGDDYYYTFETFKGAVQFIKTHPEAETQPLIAFRGYELNLYAIKPKEKTQCDTKKQ